MVPLSEGPTSVPDRRTRSGKVMVLIFPLAVADLTVADRPDRENEHPAKAGRLEDCVKRDLECSLNITSTRPYCSLEEADVQNKGVKDPWGYREELAPDPPLGLKGRVGP